MPPCPECNTELIETLPWVEGVIVEDPATAALTCPSCGYFSMPGAAVATTAGAHRAGMLVTGPTPPITVNSGTEYRQAFQLDSISITPNPNLQIGQIYVGRVPLSGPLGVEDFAVEATWTHQPIRWSRPNKLCAPRGHQLSFKFLWSI